MPKYSRAIEVKGRSAQELYDHVAQGIERFLEKSNLGKFDVEKRDEDLTVDVKSKMANAQLVCDEEQITLHAQLSLMAAPFRSKLDEGIDRWIEKTFPDS